jgi:uncharacterized protein YndB with AHSA1/START domain
MNKGTFVTVANRPAVRFEREYRQSIERVWQAVADPDQARLWFPSALVFEPRVGGAVRFTGDPHMPDSEGAVLEYDPPRLVAFTWGDGEVHIALEPLGERGCRFILTNVLPIENEAARNAAGWDVCLGEFDKVLRGERSEVPHRGAESTWQATYEVYLRSGMPAGAVIPS